ncbi:MAG: hypothetical protein ACREXX_01170 [Gammaproteobacteria bacterium]
MTYAIVILRGAQKELADLPENSARPGLTRECGTPERATSLGLIGVAGRASGQQCDLRVQCPILPYDRLEVQTSTRRDGDVDARVAVRSRRSAFPCNWRVRSWGHCRARFIHRLTRRPLRPAGSAVWKAGAARFSPGCAPMIWVDRGSSKTRRGSRMAVSRPACCRRVSGTGGDRLAGMRYGFVGESCGPARALRAVWTAYGQHPCCPQAGHTLGPLAHKLHSANNY